MQTFFKLNNLLRKSCFISRFYQLYLLKSFYKHESHEENIQYEWTEELGYSKYAMNLILLLENFIFHPEI